MDPILHSPNKLYGRQKGELLMRSWELKVKVRYKRTRNDFH